MARRRLKTLSDCRCYLASLINRCESGQIEPQFAGRMAYITNILRNVIQEGDLEQRISVLEQRMESEKGKKRSRGLRTV